MGEKEKSQEFFEYLVKQYPVESRFKSILTQIQDILESLGIMDYVQINTDILGQAIVDYFEDVDRLKRYEDIERINVDKIYGYEVYWLIKRKPIQLVKADIPIEYLYINEKVCTIILVAKMLVEMKKGSDEPNPRISSFLSLIYYNFKYRLFTQKSLELMVEAFFCGCSFK